MKYRDSSFLYKTIALFGFGSFVLVIIYLSFSHVHRQHLLRRYYNIGTTSNSHIENLDGVHPDRLASIQVIWPPMVGSPQENVYPEYRSLLDVVYTWNPDIPDPPPVFKESLQHFNYSDPDQRIMASRYRDAELPFKIYDIPEITKLNYKWTDDYLSAALNKYTTHTEKSKNNHFMYWNGRRNDPEYVPPTQIIDEKFPAWRKKAQYADDMKISNASEHFYFMTNSNVGDPDTWIAKDLDIFSTDTENFFITNVEANKGIQCRFGMRGIIAESHYDTGRNMVAMLKGNKRYILNPPKACDKLGIITDRKHPSFRHSVLDWSDERQAEASGFAHVQAIDTIVRTGEVLYIPSFWFHYVISLEYSIQCNSRSGTPPGGQGRDVIDKCMGGLALDGYNSRKQRRRKRRGAAAV